MFPLGRGTKTCLLLQHICWQFGHELQLVLPWSLFEDDLFAGSIVWQFAEHNLGEASKFVQDLFYGFIIGLSCEFHVFGTKIVPVIEYARHHLV